MVEDARLVVEINAAESSEDDDEEGDDIARLLEVMQLEDERTKVKKALKSIDEELLSTAHQALRAMHVVDAPREAIGVLRSGIEKLVTDHYSTVESKAVAWFDSLASKYGTTLGAFEAQRETAAAQLKKHLKELGYE